MSFVSRSEVEPGTRQGVVRGLHFLYFNATIARQGKRICFHAR